LLLHQAFELSTQVTVVTHIHTIYDDTCIPQSHSAHPEQTATPSPGPEQLLARESERVDLREIKRCKLPVTHKHRKNKSHGGAYPDVGDVVVHNDCVTGARKDEQTSKAPQKNERPQNHKNQEDHLHL
jgi:hypothetical protein